MTIYTVGHSTRSIDEFIGLLRAHKITRLADIRTIPRSRRHPHFAREALARALPEHGIAYEHFPELGGLRRPRRDSPNTGWRNDSFRGYADYMQTGEFERGLRRLLEYAADTIRLGRDADEPNGAPNTVVMCAEAVWWRCHRALLADALVVRGVTVCHILTIAAAHPHQLCDFARTEGTSITYMADNEGKSASRGNRKASGSV